MFWPFVSWALCVQPNNSKLNRRQQVLKILKQQLLATYKGNNREEGESDGGLDAADARAVRRSRRLPPRVGQVTETDEPEERPRTCSEKHETISNAVLLSNSLPGGHAFFAGGSPAKFSRVSPNIQVFQDVL